jgi:hypothetical protein
MVIGQERAMTRGDILSRMGRRLQLNSAAIGNGWLIASKDLETVTYSRKGHRVVVTFSLTGAVTRVAIDGDTYRGQNKHGAAMNILRADPVRRCHFRAVVAIEVWRRVMSTSLIVDKYERDVFQDCDAKGIARPRTGDLGISFSNATKDPEISEDCRERDATHVILTWKWTVPE